MPQDAAECSSAPVRRRKMQPGPRRPRIPLRSTTRRNDRCGPRRRFCPSRFQMPRPSRERGKISLDVGSGGARRRRHRRSATPVITTPWGVIVSPTRTRVTLLPLIRSLPSARGTPSCVGIVDRHRYDGGGRSAQRLAVSGTAVRDCLEIGDTRRPASNMSDSRHRRCMWGFRNE